MVTGFWAPTGTSIPKHCPTSGFYCPGRLADTLTLGAEPLVFDLGTTSEIANMMVNTTVVEETIEQVVTMEGDLETFNTTAYRYELAQLYGIPVKYIKLDAAPGSIVLNIIFSVPTGSSSDSSSSPALSMAAVLALVSTVNASALSQVAVVSSCLYLHLCLCLYLYHLCPFLHLYIPSHSIIGIYLGEAMCTSAHAPLPLHMHLVYTHSVALPMHNF